MAFYLQAGNRLETLGRILVEMSRLDPLPPLEPEIVVLQSGGMARWLSLLFADETGVCAHLDCPFPNEFINRVFKLLIPEIEQRPLFDPGTLHWHLMKLLPGLSGMEGFEPIAGYLAGSRGPRLFQLAGRIADLYDQYTVHRPELIASWEGGEGRGWQARLWRELIGDGAFFSRYSHRAALLRDFMRLDDRLIREQVGLPRRLAVFGISSLPPCHLEVFTRLSRLIDVHVFALSPCREYWFDLLTDRSRSRLSLAAGREEAELYLTEGNPLLASMGQQGKEFFSLLHDRDPVVLDFHEVPAESSGAPASRLSLLQGDILEMANVEGGAEPVGGCDNSISIHSCHSPVRELEVLHDQLLGALEEFEDLEPGEILVMVPDIEKYGPLIQDIFGRRPAGGQPLPFSIADRGLRYGGRLSRPFLQLLKMSDCRFEIDRVLTLLEFEPIRRRFAIAEEDLTRIEQLLRAVKVRWGIDGGSKAEMGLPDQDENTWQAGFKRLLLGYAMEGDGRRTFAGIHPYREMEGDNCALLGRLLDFTGQLFSCLRGLAGERPPADWSRMLLDILAGCLAAGDDDADELRLIREQLAGLAEAAEAGWFDEPVGFSVIDLWLRQALSIEGPGGGFLRGGITFCEMLPMRAIPFKMICLLGLNDADYPRSSVSPGFDLIAASPRPGDRSRRYDDRYLFLEAVLSARRRLYLSYVGQSVRDGKSLAPSVLVSELQEYLERRFPAAGQLVVVHPLHPFSPDYFLENDRGLFSYSRQNCRAAAAGLISPAPPPVFADRPLPPPADSERIIRLVDLLAFYRNPARLFCRKRLGIFISEADDELENTENFELAGLDRYQLGMMMLEDYGLGSAAFYEEFRGRDLLPHGAVGRVSFDELAEAVRDVAVKMAARRGEGGQTALFGEVVAGTYTVEGEVELNGGGGLLTGRFASLKAGDRISFWIRHLFCCALSGAGASSFLIGRDKSFEYQPVSDSRRHLKELCDYYWAGLRGPLAFFPESSLAYAEGLAKGGSAGMRAAQKKWEGNPPWSRGEKEDAYRQLCFGESGQPLDEDFRERAVGIYAPMLAGCTKI